MDQQQAFLVALAITLAVSASIVFLLWRPLHGILVDLCGSDIRARFWRCYANLMLVLVPTTALMMGRVEQRVGETPLFLIIDQIKWAVFGLITALFLVAVGIGIFLQNKEERVSISPEHMDDLHRLLEKVDEIRARQVLRRVDAPEEKHA
jgi:hypothetical protein